MKDMYKEKECAYCHKTMEISEFPIKSNYVSSYCKKCWLVYKKTLYKRAVFNIEKIDGEEWKEIIPGQYSVSNKGRVKSHGRRARGKIEKYISEKILKPRANMNGYMVVWMRAANPNGKSVHRLVATHFIPNPDSKKCVNHIDGDKKNNAVENLEWCTHGENQRHAYKNNLRKSKKGSTYEKTRINRRPVKRDREASI